MKIIPSESFLQIPCHSNAKRLDYVRLVSHPWQRSQNVLAVPQNYIHKFIQLQHVSVRCWIHGCISPSRKTPNLSQETAWPLLWEVSKTTQKPTFHLQTVSTLRHFNPTQKTFWRSGQDGRSCVQFKTLTHDGSMELVRVFTYIWLKFGVNVGKYTSPNGSVMGKGTAS